MKTVKCPAGQWTPIFDHAFVQMPNAWTVKFVTADGRAPEGEVAEKKSSWIMPGVPQVRSLQPVMHFKRGWWNTFFSVRVRPARDVTAEIG